VESYTENIRLAGFREDKSARVENIMNSSEKTLASKFSSLAEYLGDAETIDSEGLAAVFSAMQEARNRAIRIPEAIEAVSKTTSKGRVDAFKVKFSEGGLPLADCRDFTETLRALAVALAHKKALPEALVKALDATCPSIIGALRKDGAEIVNKAKDTYAKQVTDFGNLAKVL